MEYILRDNLVFLLFGKTIVSHIFWEDEATSVSKEIDGLVCMCYDPILHSNNHTIDFFDEVT